MHLAGKAPESAQRTPFPGWLIVIAALILFAIAIGLGVAATMPLERIAPLGALVRRPGDVTPERHQRLVQVATLLAAIAAISAVLVLLLRQRLSRRLAAIPHELRWAATSRLMEVPWRSVGILVVAGVVLRVHFLDVPVSYDEAYSFLNYARRPWYEAIADYNSTNNHVLNTFLMHWCYRIWGQQEWALRLPALAAGILLVVAAYPWARLKLGDEPSAILATALVACLPVLIDYSVNARGYMFVTALAVVVDFCLECVHRRCSFSTVAWLAAWTAAVLGFWAMPIMIYPLAGISAWYVLLPGGPAWSTYRGRLMHVVGFSAVVGGGVLILYTPAYVFRGFTAGENPFVQPIEFTEWLASISTVWSGAFTRWAAGPIPAAIWLGIFIAGWIALGGQPATFAKCLALFAATAVLMTLHRVAPPPRLFVFLTPWTALVLAAGAAWILAQLAAAFPSTDDEEDSQNRSLAVASKCERQTRTALMAAFLFLASTFLYVHELSAIIDPEQRSESLVGLRPLADHLAQRIRSKENRPVRVFAPLPCDVPTIYYLEQRGVQATVNGTPATDERLFLITQGTDSPADTLANMVVKLPGQAEELGPWHRIRAFQGCSLWLSERRLP